MLNKKLKDLRRGKGLSVSELSAKSNVSVSYIYELENGTKKNPSLEVIKQLAAALDVSHGEFDGEY